MRKSIVITGAALAILAIAGTTYLISSSRHQTPIYDSSAGYDQVKSGKYQWHAPLATSARP